LGWGNEVIDVLHQHADKKKDKMLTRAEFCALCSRSHTIETDIDYYFDRKLVDYIKAGGAAGDARQQLQQQQQEQEQERRYPPPSAALAGQQEQEQKYPQPSAAHAINPQPSAPPPAYTPLEAQGAEEELQKQQLLPGQVSGRVE
jgi:hypothetical protein